MIAVKYHFSNFISNFISIDQDNQLIKYLIIITLYSYTIVMAELFRVPTQVLARQAAVIFGWMK